MHRIPYARQQIEEDDIEAVVRVLRSACLTQGPAVPAFERLFADYVGAKHAVAVSNGTAALHLGALALGIRPGQKVITTPITFAATANCIRYAGGEAIFADIDPETYVLDIARVEHLLATAPKGTYAGIIPVDFAGRPVDLEALRALADAYGCWIMEDACHAPGGFFRDADGVRHFCGDGSLADLSVFSFHPVKHIAMGEGGVITTNDDCLAAVLRNLRSHGIQQDPALRLRHDGPWYYEMQALGFNYRLTDMQAALGASQLKRAEAGLARRREIAMTYARAFEGHPNMVRLPDLIDGHALHLYVAEFQNRDDVLRHLRRRNIFAQVHYIPLHRMPYYAQFGWKPGDLPNAEAYYRRCLSLPLFPALREEEQAHVIACVREFYATQPGWTADFHAFPPRDFQPCEDAPATAVSAPR